MDLPDVGARRHHLPAGAARRARCLYLGDCHAVQGDGELCGVALEIPATVEIQIDLIKDHTDRLAAARDRGRVLMTIGSARPMEDAARIAYRELVRWSARRVRDVDELRPTCCSRMCGKVRLGNMVDPKYTVGASVAKKYFR